MFCKQATDQALNFWLHNFWQTIAFVLRSGLFPKRDCDNRYRQPLIRHVNSPFERRRLDWNWTLTGWSLVRSGFCKKIYTRMFIFKDLKKKSYRKLTSGLMCYNLTVFWPDFGQIRYNFLSYFLARRYFETLSSHFLCGYLTCLSRTWTSCLGVGQCKAWPS